MIDEADQLEYEVWVASGGPDMWRRFIAAAPRNQPLAKIIIQIAKLDPIPLSQLMIQVVA